MAQNEFFVLIIDDNPDHIELIKEFTEGIQTRLGSIRFKGFTDKYEGIAFFKKNHNKIGTVLLDFTLPKLNGIKVLEILRDFNGIVPIIGLTGHSKDAFKGQGNSISEQFIKAGAVGYISKTTENFMRIDELIEDLLVDNKFFQSTCNEKQMKI